VATAKGKEAEAQAGLANLNLGSDRRSPRAAPPQPPPRPTTQAPKAEESDEEVEDENDPFGDSNAVQTPAIERSEPSW
jgi:hypothetical protein